MKRFTGAIKKSLDTQNWYGALFIALTMPDICGKIAYPNLGPKDRYKKWFDSYLSNYYKHEIGANHEETVFMSASDCYALRCSIFHAGIDEVIEQSSFDVVSRFSFSTARAHCNRINNVLQLNVEIFCKEIIQAVEKWSNDVKNNADAQNGIKNLLTIHEGGYSPMPGVWIS